VISQVVSAVDKVNVDTEKNLLDILDRVDDIHLEAVDQTHLFTLSQAYEGLLQKMGEKNNDGGQFFAPREVIRGIVRAIDRSELAFARGQVMVAAHAAGLQPIDATFLFIASFSIVAGIMLLVNIFVMLADERRGQLGMLRAVAYGWTQAALADYQREAREWAEIEGDLA